MKQKECCTLFIENHQMLLKFKNKWPMLLWFRNYRKEKYRPYDDYIEAISQEEGVALSYLLGERGKWQINVLMPDDTLQQDIRRIKGLVLKNLHCGCINLSYQSLYLSKEVREYVALMQSYRCIVIKYIKDNQVIQESYMPTSSKREEVIQEIKDLHSRLLTEVVPIFIIETLETKEEIATLGKIVRSEEMMLNYEWMQLGK